MQQPIKKIGKQTLQFMQPPVVLSFASIVGPMEGKGPYGSAFDYILEDTLFGEKSWEKAESKMLRETIKMTLQKANLTAPDVDFMLAGDLLNQIVAANFAAREITIPFLGLYGACSTMAESIGLGSILIDGGFAHRVIAGVSSHHHTAERQFRFPTEQGVHRPLWSQWTVTGSGGILLAREGNGPVITHLTVGQVVDLGIKDSNDMGAAMAPAAVDTLIRHFQDLNRQSLDYDLILTGDLGTVGLKLTWELLKMEGYRVENNLKDCGVLLYHPEQDTHAGGSGCGCSAVMLCGPILRRVVEGAYRRVLFVGTGALLSPTTVYQGESVPSIAHAVVIEYIPPG
ncbi:MAG: stage V sporulation protein AD [Syntrophomonadaceae bacterium]|nr:stage V sporulation protein AD [Syntrophomonadaceae bacterium]